MNAKLHISPITPCCDDCVTGALRHAEFNFTQPFLVLGLQELAPEERRAAVDQFLLHAPGSVALLVSSVDDADVSLLEDFGEYDPDVEVERLRRAGVDDTDFHTAEGCEVHLEPVGSPFGSGLVMFKTDVDAYRRVRGGHAGGDSSVRRNRRKRGPLNAWSAGVFARCDRASSARSPRMTS